MHPSSHPYIYTEAGPQGPPRYQSPYFHVSSMNERISRNAKALRRIIDVNRKVHTALYNRIIAEQAAKVGKA